MNEHANNHWQANASREVLAATANLLNKLRKFFAERGVMEVTTPIMAKYTTTDVHLDSLQLSNGYFLQTSPEYAMKRLLASGSGCIFQICKAFRDEPESKLHNPEFTILEWYRVGFDHHQLMDEMEQLLCETINCQPAQKISYRQAFIEYVDIDPINCSLTQLLNKAKTIHLSEHLLATAEADDLLQILFNHFIEPNLSGDSPFFIYDYPASQAALAKINHQDPTVASRFEVFYQGVELANGFYELQDSQEQNLRFINDNHTREKIGKKYVDIDHRLLAALEHGLPECSGVAMGFDRLLMLYLKLNNIEEALSFSFNRA